VFRYGIHGPPVKIWLNRENTLATNFISLSSRKHVLKFYLKQLQPSSYSQTNGHRTELTAHNGDEHHREFQTTTLLYLTAQIRTLKYLACTDKSDTENMLGLKQYQQVKSQFHLSSLGPINSTTRELVQVQVQLTFCSVTHDKVVKTVTVVFVHHFLDAAICRLVT